MNNLVRTEWLKIKKYRSFWWVIGITALAYPGINYISYTGYQHFMERGDNVSKLAQFYTGSPFSFPEVWHTVAYLSTYFVFIPAVVVIMFISNEYSYKTHRQNIIDGWSRRQFISSKLIDVLITSLLITVLYILVALVIGFCNPIPAGVSVMGQSYYIGLFILQTFAQLSLAFLVGFLVRKAFIALGVFLFYFIVLENILVGVLRVRDYDFRRYLPLQISNRLIPMPAFIKKLDVDAYNKSIADIQPHIFYTLLLTALVWFICYWVQSKKDLK